MTTADDTGNNDDKIHYCPRCDAEGKKTPLFYSNPPNKDFDTWSKGLAKKSDYRCLQHVKQDSRLYKTRAGRVLHKARSDSIEQYHQRRVMAFHKMWNDKTLIDDRGFPLYTLSDPEHLMWIFIVFKIRKALDGFTAAEMTEVIREDDIEFDINRKVAEWKDDAKDRGITLLVREQVEPELIKIYVSMKEEMQEAHRRSLVNSVRGMANAANMLWQRRPEEEWEKIVVTPEHRDPDGNRAPRLHLLTEAETLTKRQERKLRQIRSIENIMKDEEKTQESAQRHVEDKTPFQRYGRESELRRDPDDQNRD